MLFSSFQRNALNALLYRTGESSHKFMLVMATNRPDDLDSAVNDRVDESMLFDLPDKVRYFFVLWLRFARVVALAHTQRAGGTSQPVASVLRQIHCKGRVRAIRGRRVPSSEFSED